MMDKVAFYDPNIGVTFVESHAGPIQVLVASDLELPERLKIRRAVLPPWKLHIEWDGATWGQRGSGERQRIAAPELRVHSRTVAQSSMPYPEWRARTAFSDPRAFSGGACCTGRKSDP